MLKMHSRRSRTLLLLLLAVVILVGVACETSTFQEGPPEPGNEMPADEAMPDCDSTFDPMVCDRVVEDCTSGADTQQCTESVDDCAQVEGFNECLDAVGDCSQVDEPQECLDSVRDCTTSPEPKVCIDELKPIIPSILDEIGLKPNTTLRADAMFESGRCGGSDFGARLTFKYQGRFPMLEQQQAFGTQVTRGRELSDGKTLVFVDDDPKRGEIYVLQEGKKDELRGLNLYAPNGLPDFQDIPRLDPMLRDAATRGLFDPGSLNRVLNALDAPSDTCDYPVTMRLR